MVHLNRGWIYTDRVPIDAVGVNVHQFYVQRYPHSSAAVWAERLRRGQVSLDGVQVTGAELLAAGQILRYHRPPWRETEVPRNVLVLHDDEHLLAVRKPSGLPTMPGGEFLENTLLHILRARYGNQVAPLHRLGRATSGIVLFVRSPVARRRLSADLRNGRIRKIYRALVQGADCPAAQTIDVPIGTVPYAPLGRIHAAARGGRAARSLVRVLERRPAQNAALVEVEIPTGRPHQIRIHLAAVGHPLCGDSLYAHGGLPVAPRSGERPPLPGDGGYHLHAWRVDLIHPGTGHPLTLCCTPPQVLRTGPAHIRGSGCARGG